MLTLLFRIIIPYCFKGLRIDWKILRNRQIALKLKSYFCYKKQKVIRLFICNAVFM